MTLTAFLPTGAPQVLPFIGTPGAATVGHALVWSESPQGFALSPITVGPDQFSGVLPVSKGGWGTNTGSFTSPGAISLTAGGTTNDLNLVIAKSAKVRIGSSATEGSFLAVGPVNVGYNPADLGASNYGGIGAKGSTGGIFYMQDASNNGGQFFYDSNGLSFSNITNSTASLVRFNSGNAQLPGSPDAIRITTTNDVVMGRGTVAVLNTTESTSTTTGALQIAGGLGVVKSLYAAATAGSKVNFANLPTASTGLNSGDLWRDSNGFLRIV